MVIPSLTSSVHIFSPADTAAGRCVVIMTQEKASALEHPDTPVWGLPGGMVETDPCGSDRRYPGLRCQGVIGVIEPFTSLMLTTHPLLIRKPRLRDTWLAHLASSNGWHGCLWFPDPHLGTGNINLELAWPIARGLSALSKQWLSL